MPVFFTLGRAQPYRGEDYKQQQSSKFWNSTNLSTYEISYYLDLILKSNPPKNDFTESIKFYRSHPEDLEKNLADIQDHIKKFQLGINEYIALTVSGGTTIGQFYLIKNNHIVYQSNNLGYVSDIEQITTNANQEMIIKGNASGSGTYKESGYIIKHNANQYRLVGAYPINGYFAPGAKFSGYVVSFHSQPLLYTSDKSKRFLIHIFLDMKAGSEKEQVLQEYGFSANSTKSCELKLTWNKTKKYYISNLNENCSNKNLLDYLIR